MAQNTTIALASRTWTQLTNTDATSATFMNLGPATVYIKGTVGATPPTDTLGGLAYEPGQGELNTSLANMWPGIAATRLYAYSGTPTEVMISHA
jgi:hypothetical protein